MAVSNPFSLSQGPPGTGKTHSIGAIAIYSFQGSQRDYFIICTTRNGATLGFFSDRRRMNVAITRARCFAINNGNELTLS